MNNDQENYLKDLFFSIRENNDSELTKVISDIRKEKPETLRLILFKLQKDKDVLISEKILTANFIRRLRNIILKSKSHSEIIEIISNDVRKHFSSLPKDELNAKIKEAITAYETEIAKKKKKTRKEKTRRKEKSKKTDPELIAEFTTNLEKQLAHKSPEERKKRVEEDVKRYKETLARRNKSVDQLIKDEESEITKKINEFLDSKKLDEQYQDLLKEYLESILAARIKFSEDIVVPTDSKTSTPEDKSDPLKEEMTKFTTDLQATYTLGVKNEVENKKLFQALTDDLKSLIVKIVNLKYLNEDLAGKNEAIEHLLNKHTSNLTNIFEEYDGYQKERAKLFKEHFERTIKLYKDGLEDTKVFNQRMDEKRKELEEIKYGDTVEGLDKMRKILIEVSIKAKKEFLGVVNEDDAKNFQANKEKMRTFEPGKEPIVNTIAPIEDPNAKEEEEVDLDETNPVSSNDDKKFEHNRPEFISHESITRSNFRDMGYYYRARKFFNDHPDKLKPYINLLYHDTAIQAIAQPTEEEIKVIDERDALKAKKREEAKENRAKERVRIEAETAELKSIDEQLIQLQTYIDDGKLTIDEANERAETLITRRNILCPPEKTPEQLLTEYSVEMREKYSKIENVQFERKSIISMELSEYSKLVKREIARDRKLREERLEKTNELKKDRKYMLVYNEDVSKIKYNTSKITDDVNDYIKRREKELNEYFITHGVDPKEHDDVSIRNARTVFADYTKQKVTDAWKSMDPDMKIEYMRAKYANFYDAFPIVVKFMVQQDKFEVEAFKRFLEKCRTNVAEKGANPYSTQIPKKGTRRLTASEEKWLENQAFYAQYLVEEYRKRHGQRLGNTEGNWLRQRQYDALRKEMMDFRQNFEKVAEELKGKHDDNDMKLIMEYLDQMKSGQCDLTPEEQENIAFAVEQIVKKKEDLKKKIKDVETDVKQDLVDIESKQNDLKEDDEPEKPKSKSKPKSNEELEIEALQAERKANKTRLLKIHKKNKAGQKLTFEEREEFVKLKKYFGYYEEEKKEKTDKLSETLGCNCLHYRCAKCTVPLTKEEQQNYQSKIKAIKSKPSDTRTIHEAFIVKSPSKDTVLQEYAGGYLEPVSVRQFLTRGDFTIHGDNIHHINANRKYGGFWTDTTKNKNLLQSIVQKIAPPKPTEVKDH
jgi:hypothetical protein